MDLHSGFGLEGSEFGLSLSAGVQDSESRTLPCEVDGTRTEIKRGFMIMPAENPFSFSFSPPPIIHLHKSRETA